MIRKPTHLVFAGMLLCAGSAAAQDVRLQPTFGEVNLAAGFSPGLLSVEVIAGGPIDTGVIPGTDAFGIACEGSVANAPDYRLNYTAGDAPLILLIRAREDTALIINGPDGTWYCNDDGAGWPDPTIAFAWPISGQYDIWIAGFDGGNPEATLTIAEDMRLLPPPAEPPPVLASVP